MAGHTVNLPRQCATSVCHVIALFNCYEHTCLCNPGTVTHLSSARTADVAFEMVHMKFNSLKLLLPAEMRCST
jgi:hypothetical protein